MRSAAARGTTVQPSPMPWMSESGMRRAVCPKKPTTSAITRAPSVARISQAVPTGTRGSAASSTSPAARTTVPVSGIGSASAMARAMESMESIG